MEQMSDVKKALKCFTKKRPHHDRCYDYYYGHQPMKWMNDRLKEVFGEYVKFIENWCSVVVDTTTDRISLEGFSIAGNPSQTKLLTRLMDQTGIEVDSAEIHRDAVIAGEGYLIAWKDDENGTEAYRNDPRGVHLFYDPDHPKKKQYGAKLWESSDARWRLALYYSDRVEFRRTKSVGKGSKEYSREENWEMDEEAGTGGIIENPYGQVPVFRFTPDSISLSDVDRAIPLQDVVNKVKSDMMISAEFSAAQTRLILSNNEFPAKIPFKPFETITLTPHDKETEPTQFGTFPASDLSNFLRVMDATSHAMGVISRCPRHYFWSQTGVPSGESLLAMEAPLSTKVTHYLHRFSREWKRAAVFLMELEGQKVDLYSIEPVWADVRTVQPLSQAQIRQTNVSAGMPLITQLRDEGWTEEEIQEMLKDQQNTTPTATTGQPQQLQEQTATNIQSDMETAIQAVADAALEAVMKSGVVDRVVPKAA